MKVVMDNSITLKDLRYEVLPKTRESLRTPKTSRERDQPNPNLISYRNSGFSRGSVSTKCEHFRRRKRKTNFNAL